MARTHSSIATDSAAELERLIGEDATSTFENDPGFVAARPTATASSDNIAVQRDTDDLEDSNEEEVESDEEEEEEEEEEAALHTDRAIDEALRMRSRAAGMRAAA